MWVQDRANEALDTAVLCLAALHVLGGTNPAAYVRRQADVIAAALSGPESPTQTSGPTDRRVARSKYLG